MTGKFEVHCYGARDRKVIESTPEWEALKLLLNNKDADIKSHLLVKYRVCNCTLTDDITLYIYTVVVSLQC